MPNSTFIPLSNQVLLEYIYGEETNQQDFGFNDFHIINTPDGKQLINPDSFEDGVSVNYTNNVRNRTAVLKETNKSNKYVWSGVELDGAQSPIPTTDWIVNEGEEFDITLSEEFTINETTDVDNNLVEGVLYDRVKVHFVTGFNYDQQNGFVLNLQTRDNLSNKLILAKHLFLKDKQNFELNPNPFLYSEKLFDKYIEFQIPSMKRLNSEFNRVENEFVNTQDKLDNSLLHHLTDASVTNYNFLQVQYFEIERIEKVRALMRDDIDFVEENQDYTFLYTINFSNATIPFSERSENISIEIKQSSNGDYFEFRGLHKNLSINNYIKALNLQGHNYILIYDIDVIEHIDESTIETTNSVTLYQTDAFDEPVIHRPIISNGSSIALSLNVNMRLYDRTTSTQFAKTARITLTEADDSIVQKYGPYQNIINLSTEWEGYNFEQRDIYNLNPAAQIISLPDTLNDRIMGSQIKYLYRFIDTHNLTFQQRSVEIDEVGNIASNDSINITKLFGNEKAIIILDHETNYLRLTFYDKKNNYFLRKNLAGRGTLEIHLGNIDSSFKYQSLELDNVNKTDGELIFKIPKNDSGSIQKEQLLNNKFRIVSTQGSESTVLYRGKFRFGDQDKFDDEVSFEDQSKTSDIIEDLQQTVSNLKQELNNSKKDKQTIEKKVIDLNQQMNENIELVQSIRDRNDILMMEDFIINERQPEDFRGSESPNFK